MNENEVNSVNGKRKKRKNSNNKEEESEKKIKQYNSENDENTLNMSTKNTNEYKVEKQKNKTKAQLSQENEHLKSVIYELTKTVEELKSFKNGLINDIPKTQNRFQMLDNTITDDDMVTDEEEPGVSTKIIQSQAKSNTKTRPQSQNGKECDTTENKQFKPTIDKTNRNILINNIPNKGNKNSDNTDNTVIQNKIKTPPIYVHNCNPKEFIEKMKNLHIEEFNIKQVHVNKFAVITEKINDYNTIKKMLEELNTQYFTYTLKEEKNKTWLLYGTQLV